MHGAEQDGRDHPGRRARRPTEAFLAVVLPISSPMTSLLLACHGVTPGGALGWLLPGPVPHVGGDSLLVVAPRLSLVSPSNDQDDISAQVLSGKGCQRGVVIAVLFLRAASARVLHGRLGQAARLLLVAPEFQSIR